MRTLTNALRLHQQEAASFVAAAEVVSESSWNAPIAPGKWSPAQITEHLIAAYEVLIGELGGGPPMRIRTSRWQRIVLRFTMMPRLLRGKAFPRGARAPRETRPGESVGDRGQDIERFRRTANEFAAAAIEAGERNPGQRLTHAYFGRSGLADGVIFCARHIAHHRAQLPGADSLQTVAGGRSAEDS